MTTAEEQELAFAGPGELARRVRAREVHPRELVELCLRRIESIDPQLNAFRVVLADEALRAADGPLHGPLAGVPFAVKDDQPLAGQVTTQGTRLPLPVAGADAEIVRRLRAAGGIPIGVTNVPELCIQPWTASDANGVTRNPWDPSRTPGGSSGGSAAAVAAGLVPFATGSDGGGSIRIPAACCGLVGMKPSRGRVSCQPFGEMWMGLSTYGTLARTVADSALLLDVTSGATAADEERVADPGTPFSEASHRLPARLRVAVSRKVPPGVRAALSPDQANALDRVARLLAGAGHRLVERDPDYGAAGLEFTALMLAGIHADYQRLGGRPDLVERHTRQLAAAGRTAVPPRLRSWLKQRRHRSAARLATLWSDVDVLLTPCLSRTALPAEGGYGRGAIRAFDLASRFTPYTPAWNLTGQPALAVPAGIAADGLPTSVQLVGRHGSEGLLYALAGELEALAPFAGDVPALAGR